MKSLGSRVPSQIGEGWRAGRQSGGNIPQLHAKGEGILGQNGPPLALRDNAVKEQLAQTYGVGRTPCVVAVTRNNLSWEEQANDLSSQYSSSGNQTGRRT